MIKIDNLDEAHSSLTELIIKENEDGVELLNKMKELIVSLNDHWIGNDATTNINKLIDVHGKLQSFILATLESTKSALISMVNLQEVRKANGGGGQIGDVYSIDTSFACSISKIPQTTEYYVDPSLKNDYTSLEYIEENLKAFDSYFKGEVDTIMNNWKSGSDREGVKANFDEINTLSTTMENTIEEVKQELSTVINNMDQVIN